MIVFAYGSLTDPERQRILTGREFAKVPAVLPGYRLDEEPGCYRMIYPDPAGEVRGFAIQDVDDAALRAFDEWEAEGTLYRRVGVEVVCNGERLAAWAYEGMGRREKVAN